MKRILFVTAVLVFMAMPAIAGIVYTNDFESNAVGFSGAGALAASQGYSAHGFGRQFLYNSTTGLTTLTLTSLAAHNSINLNFSLAAIDSWDGNTGEGGTVPQDYFNVAIDGASVFRETFDNFILTDGSYSPPAGGLLSSNSDLAVNPGWPDSAYDMAVETAFLNIAHTGSTLTIDFFANGGGWQGGADESWAIDNVTVEILPIPAPGALLLSSMGLGIIATRRLKGRKTA